MLWHILQVISKALDDSPCYYHAGRFHFPLDNRGTMTLAVSCDSMSRVRMDVCRLGQRRASVWAFRGDDARLVSVVDGVQSDLQGSPTTI